MIARTPYHDVPITLALVASDRKFYREVFCIECGHPFLSITDKIVGVLDANVVVKRMGRDETLIEARCRFHECKQRYNLYLTLA